MASSSGGSHRPSTDLPTMNGIGTSSGHGHSHTPSSSLSLPQTAGALRAHLDALLDSKERQLQLAGTLGQRVLEQQMELLDKVAQLRELGALSDKAEEEELGSDAEVRDRFRELAETVSSWEDENAQLSEPLGPKPQANGNVLGASSSIPTHGSSDSRDWSADLSALGDLSREEPARNAKAAAGATTASQSRRQKNAAHRQNDVEFAFEIGSGLLTEVRRLQSLLGERDKAIQDMKEEKDDLERTLESIRTALRQQEQSADKYKEENWNLEVSLQELRAQHADTQDTAKRLDGEQKRLTKLLAGARDQGETHKTEVDRLTVAMDDFKAKHDTDIAHARKHAASLQRDKQELQQTVDELKAAAAKAARRLPGRFGSPLTPNAEHNDMVNVQTPAEEHEEDVFGAATAPSTRRKHGDTGAFAGAGAGEFGEYLGPDYSPDPSPSRPFLAPNHPTNEIEALQQRLAHANRQIGTLKGTLMREKELRMQYRRKLEASPGGFVPGPEDEVEGDEEEEEVEVDELGGAAGMGKPKKRLTPFRTVRGRGRGRGRGGMTLQQRLGLAAAQQSPAASTVYGDDLNDDLDGSPVPPVPAIPHMMRDLDGDEPEPGFTFDAPDASPSPSNRVSVDGMDPAFANILRRSASASSLPQFPSPLRPSASTGTGVGARTVAGTFPRRRGGAAFQEARPASLVGAPEALAMELGIGMHSLSEDQQEQEEQPAKEMKEMSVQTEIEVEEEKTVVFAAKEEPVRSEMAVQAVQAEPIVERGEMGVQHESLAAELLGVPAAAIAEAPVVATTTTTQTKTRRLADADTQTSSEDEDYERHRRTTITRANLPPISTNDRSEDITIRRPLSQAVSTGGDLYEEDEAQTEFGPATGTDTEFGPTTDTEFETDMDAYQDARQSVMTHTPTESVQDFESIMTMTDNDYSDGESPRPASRVPSRQGPVSAGAVPPSSFRAPRVRRAGSSRAPSVMTSYESKSVSADHVEEPEVVIKEVVREVEVIKEVPVIKEVQVIKEVPVIKEVQVVKEVVREVPVIQEVVKEVIKEVFVPVPASKPETAEMTIQTDEWKPPIPVVAPSPIVGSPSSPQLFRVGSTSQQFQFVSPPPSAGPTTTTAPVSAAMAHIPRSRTSYTERERDRRQSIDSTISSILDDSTPKTRATSGGSIPVVIDKSRPPMMALPPPPRAPPPPTTMPPPSFIPGRRAFTNSQSSGEMPPPRPSSPPPPELLKRATTPSLHVPGRPQSRQHGSSMPANTVRTLPSTSSFRSAANAASHAQQSASGRSLLPAFGGRREVSSASLGSDFPSPRSSLSSQRLPNLPTTPGNNGAADTSMGGGRLSTDPAVIHAITQTMIGEFLYKYTRRTLGKGYGENRHKRFFWVHPYTRTLYWGSADPGSSNVTESTAKSAYIDGVRSVLDPNPMPPGIHQYSIVVSTPQREMKITAPTKERHDIWYNALKYLLTRPPSTFVSPGHGNGMAPLTPSAHHGPSEEEFIHHAHMPASPDSQRTGRGNTWNTTPRGRRSQSQMSMRGSLGKRAGTPAAEYLRWTDQSPYSPGKSFEHVPGADDDADDLDFELNDDSRSDGGFDGLDNVRACCDGKHTVGRHHHHHHQMPPGTEDLLDPKAAEAARPKSPSGWSMRSRAGSTNSRSGLNLFERFGSRRSAKSSTAPAG